MEQKQPLQQTVLEIWTATCKKMKLDHQLMPYTKINSRWIKDLNKSCDTMEVLEENIGMKFSDIPCSNIFTDMFSRASDIQESINKWNYIKLKSFYMTKEYISKMKMEPTMWENILGILNISSGRKMAGTRKTLTIFHSLEAGRS